MTRGFVDWQDLGILPLQDHDGVIPPELRQQVVGGRIAKMRDPQQGDPAEEAWVEYGTENDLGTLGDVHPWLFWQTSDTEARGMGSWSMAWGAITTGGGGGGTGRGSRGPISGSSQRGGFYNIGGEILPKPGLSGGGGRSGRRTGGTDNVTVQPLADSSANPDTRYVPKTPGWPKCFNSVPQGIEMMVVPGTAESSQQEVMLWADPRLIAPTVEGPAECGTLVVDLQPEAEPCMDGAKEPGMDGRAARLQSAWKVIARKPSSGSPVTPTPYLSDPVQQGDPGDVVPSGKAGPGLAGIGAKDGNAIAWNLALSPLDEIPGFGMVWAKLDGAGGGTGARNRNVGGGLIGNRTRTGSGSSGGNTKQGPCKFGKFEAKHEQNHGVAFLARMDAWGPIHAGHSNDKHQIDKDRDGHAMNSAHISTDALYYRSREEDGPFYFQGEYPDTDDYPLYSDVELVWDEDLEHSWIRGVREGKWRWVAQVPHMAPPTTPPVPPDDEPPPTIPPRRPPTTPPTTRVPGGGAPPTFTPPGDGDIPPTIRDDPGRGPTFNFVLPGAGSERDTPQSGSRFSGPTDDPLRAITYQQVGETQDKDVSVYVVHHPFHESFAELSFRPQHWLSGLLDFARNPRVDGREVRAEESYRPTTLSMHTWGAQEGDGWDYQEFPRESRARGGTVSGGILFAPPHLQMEDYLSGGTGDLTTTRTTSYITAAPNVAFALGTPNTDGGLDEASVIIAQDTSSNRVLTISQLDSTRTPTSLISGSVNQSSGEVIVGLARGGTTAIRIPEGTTAQRPASPTGGEVRINSSSGTDTLEWYDSQGATWIAAGTGGGGGATTFVALTDTPANFTGHASKLVRVNAGETALEFEAAITSGPGSGGELVRTNGSGVIDASLVPSAATTFTALTDTPVNYTGHALKVVRVNTGATALEFTDEVPTMDVDNDIADALDINTGFINSGAGEHNLRLDGEVTWLRSSQTMALATPILTGARIINLPDRSGTVLLSSTTGAVNTFASGSDVDTEFRNSGGGEHNIVIDGQFQIDDGSFIGRIDTLTLTATRTYNLPDKSGTFAMLSDITGGGATTFIALTDTPGSYTGHGSKLVRVNAGETALEFVDGGTVYQPLDTELTALAGTTSAADALPYYTGSGTASTTTLTTFGRSLIDDADATAARTTLGAAATSHTHAASDITSGTFADARIAASNVTQHEASLTILESQITDGSILARRAANETITGVWGFDPNSASADTTYFANSGAGSHSIVVSGTIGIANGANIGAFAATPSATRVWTMPDATGTVALTSDLSSYQPLDSELTALASVTSAANALPYFTGSGTATTTTLSAFGRSLIDDADAATARTTLGAAASSHTHAASDITSGTFADVRVAETNVTQWQASLSITESQISDLGTYLEASDSPTITGTWTFDPNNALAGFETTFLNSGAGSHSVRVDGNVVFDRSFDGTLQSASITAARTWTLPDATGTIALTSNIVSTFAALTDGPMGYGSSGDVLVSSGSAVAWETPTTTSAGAANAGDLVRLLASGRLDNSLITFPAFTGLTEGPGSFTGNAGEFMRVNGGETALEYVDLDTLYVPLSGTSSITGNLQSSTVGTFTMGAPSGTLVVSGGLGATFQGSSANIVAVTGDVTLAPSGTIKCSSKRITALADGTASTDAINLGQLDGRIDSGASFPGSPAEGALFYRTDLDLLFYYDSSRTKWLSTHLAVYSCGRNATGITTYVDLRRENGMGLSLAPWVMPCAGVVVGYGGRIHAGTVTNTDFLIGTYSGGSMTTTLVTINRTALYNFSASNTNAAFSSGDLLAVDVDPTPGSDSINYPSMDVYVRWTAT